MTIRLLKAALLLLLWLPLGALLLGALNLPYGYSLGANPVNFFIDVLGLWGLRYLMLTLALTPLRELTHNADWLKFRRTIGLSAFAYLSVHTLFYLGVDLRFSLKALLTDLRDYPWILVGALGLTLMVPLAATSTDRWLRRLKKRWKQLHSLVYLATLLGCWHFFWQVKKDKTEPLIYVGIYLALMSVRLPWVVRVVRRLYTPTVRQPTVS